MKKTEILKKINEAVEVKANLEKKSKELDASHVKIKELTSNNEGLLKINELLKSKTNELNAEILIEKDSKANEELLKNDLYESLVVSNIKNKKYSYFLITSLVMLCLSFGFSGYLYFFSDIIPENERNKLFNDIKSKQSENNMIENKLSSSLSAMKIIKNDYDELKIKYDSGENCSRIPFIK